MIEIVGITYLIWSYMELHLYCVVTISFKNISEMFKKFYVFQMLICLLHHISIVHKAVVKLFCAFWLLRTTGERVRIKSV